jgi:hypothetical protein
VTERERLTQLLQHWNWDAFDGAARYWWNSLALQHSASLSLMTVINLWIDNVTPFDDTAFETETDGIR